MSALRTINGTEATPIAFIYVVDRKRALEFYQGVLGFKIRDSDDYGDNISLHNALLRLTVIPDHKPSQHPVVGWETTEIETVARTLADRGVAFAKFPGMEQDDLGIWTSPDGKAKLAFFSDPDGNMLMVSESN